MPTENKYRNTMLVLALAVAGISMPGCSSKGAPESTVVNPQEQAPPPVIKTPDPPAPTVAPEAVQAAVKAEKKHVLALVPLGTVPQEEVDQVAGAIGEFYGWDVNVMERRTLLASAYYKPRKRYRAEKLLHWLDGEKPRDADMIMGFTDEDISTTKGKHEDWGICGLAHLGGPGSVVSTFRIKRKLGKGLDKQEKQRRYLKRLRELTAHEFGHQLGLEHCPNRGCIMEDAKGTVTTFNHSSGKVCDDCVDLLVEMGWGRIR